MSATLKAELLRAVVVAAFLNIGVAVWAGVKYGPRLGVMCALVSHVMFRGVKIARRSGFGVMLAAVALWAGCGRTPEKHDYLVVGQTQLGGPGAAIQTWQIIMSGSKFTRVDVEALVRTTASTNKSVVILNIVKLDD